MVSKCSLDLFDGREAVIGKMTQAVKAGLLSYDEKKIRQLACTREIPLEQLKQLLEKEDSAVDYELFEKLEGILDLSISDILGNPKFDKQEDRKYWEKQWQEESPILATAKLPAGYQEDSDVGIDIGLYVRLRAIEDLAY